VCGLLQLAIIQKSQVLPQAIYMNKTNKSGNVYSNRVHVSSILHTSLFTGDTNLLP